MQGNRNDPRLSQNLTVLGSLLERRTAGMLKRFSIPKPDTQYELFDVEGLIGALDFGWPRIRLGLEADGYKPIRVGRPSTTTGPR